MENPSNIYKYNLEILKNLEADQTIYYDENRIYLDDRYLGFYRYGNNIVKINEIIKLSFIHYFNLLKMGLITDKKEKEEILELLRSSITGIKTLLNTYNQSSRDVETINMESLKLDLIKMLIDYNDKPDNQLTSVEYESEDSDSENCLRSMLQTTKEHLQMNEHNVIVNTIYVVKNKAAGVIFSIINYIFDMTNF